MKRVASGALRDLFAATEAVGDDEPFRRSFPHRGQKFEFANCHGNVVFVVLEAKRTRHAATPGRGRLKVDADAAQRWIDDLGAKNRYVLDVWAGG